MRRKMLTVSLLVAGTTAFAHHSSIGIYDEANAVIAVPASRRGPFATA